MIDIIYRVVFFILLFKLTMTLYQRRFNDTGGNKRVASLWQCVLLGALYCSIAIIRVKYYNELFIFIAIIITLVVGIIFRKKLFPYERKCEKCGKNLKTVQILFIDSKKCPICEK